MIWGWGRQTFSVRGGTGQQSPLDRPEPPAKNAALTGDAQTNPGTFVVSMEVGRLKREGGEVPGGRGVQRVGGEGVRG